MSQQQLFLACDPLGADLKDAVLQHLRATHSDLQVEDLGTHPKYYEISDRVAERVQQSGGSARGVLVCGSGMGMCIMANKRAGVYAAVVESSTAAANAAAINAANVLCLGGNVHTPQEAAAAVDAWLNTGFTQGYEQFKDFLVTSMAEIPMQEQRVAAAGIAPFPTTTTFVDGQQRDSWQPIGAMGHPSCIWCKLREDAAARDGSTRLRALVRFPAGAIEPPHHHTYGHDVLLLSGSKTVINHSSGAVQRLGPYSYLYTPAGQVHEVEYHENTVFFLGMDGPMDILWASSAKSGVQWASAALEAAASSSTWQPGA